ncbi:MAG: STAS domain-containing protein [Candidatus Omnitrophota bacterium]|jgi:anti-anti-sigma factor|nr:MAG: STAS domain-containing protein [Candidatus Omnitrophota bacterium]
MEIRISVKRNIIIMELIGKLDADSANLIEAIGQCLHDGYGEFLLNLEAIEFIDYLGMSALVLAYKEIINSKARIKVANIPAHLKNFFVVTGMDKVVDTYASVDLALESFKEDQAIENIKKMQLRRRFKRLAIDIKIDMKPKMSASPACYQADILNLSAIGAYVYGCDQFQLGDELTLTLKLGVDPKEMHLKAKVVWMSDKQVQNQLHPGMGIEFLDISKQDQDKLLAFIDKNLSLTPSE